MAIDNFIIMYVNDRSFFPTRKQLKDIVRLMDTHGIVKFGFPSHENAKRIMDIIDDIDFHSMDEEEGEVIPLPSKSSPLFSLLREYPDVAAALDKLAEEDGLVGDEPWWEISDLEMILYPEPYEENEGIIDLCLERKEENDELDEEWFLATKWMILSVNAGSGDIADFIQEFTYAFMEGYNKFVKDIEKLLHQKVRMAILML